LWSAYYYCMIGKACPSRIGLGLVVVVVVVVLRNGPLVVWFPSRLKPQLKFVLRWHTTGLGE